LNKLYLATPALWEADFALQGFSWIDCSDTAACVLSFVRRDAQGANEVVAILNLTPVPRLRYRIGLPRAGKWQELLNSEAAIYGGGNVGNMGGVVAENKKCHNQPASAEFTLPPLSIIVFQHEDSLARVASGAAKAAAAVAAEPVEEAEAPE